MEDDKWFFLGLLAVLGLLGILAIVVLSETKQPKTSRKTTQLSITRDEMGRILEMVERVITEND